MKVVFHEDFYVVYTSDPAAARGRMEAIYKAIESEVEFVKAKPASREDILLAHTEEHIERVRGLGLYQISSLAAGGAIQTARLGLKEPAFGLIRPPGHHASRDSSWGFCYFNNMALALMALKARKKIETAYVLDFDMHYGDGNVNILEGREWVEVYNVNASERKGYLDEVTREMENCHADMIGISAGFDNHSEDWGGVLQTDDYREMGALVRKTAQRNKGGCFAILEGGYNHKVLGQNALALIRGLSRG